MSYSASGATAASKHRFAPWAFYGVLFGILGALSILAWGPIGVSGTYPRFIGEILGAVALGYAESNEYIQKVGHLFSRGRPSSCSASSSAASSARASTARRRRPVR